MKTKCIAILAIIIVAVSFSVMSTGAINFDIPINVMVNDNYVKMDSDPFIYNGSTYVPVRFASEALGANEVSWNSNNATAVIQYKDTTIELPAGKNYGYIDGKGVAINNGIKLVNSRVYVPVRFVAEMLDATVNWDSTYYNVQIYKSDFTLPSDLIDSKGYTNDDIYWLSRIIHAEGEGESMQGKIGIGNVILNRVRSSEYPDTIYGVIFDSQYGVQFEPTLNGTIYNNPGFDSIVAAKKALEGESIVGSSLYFLNPRIASNSWIPQNRTFNMTIGNHDFYF